jgi:hypothetical protein
MLVPEIKKRPYLKNKTYQPNQTNHKNEKGAGAWHKW